MGEHTCAAWPLFLHYDPLHPSISSCSSLGFLLHLRLLYAMPATLPRDVLPLFAFPISALHVSKPFHAKKPRTLQSASNIALLLRSDTIAPMYKCASVQSIVMDTGADVSFDLLSRSNHNEMSALNNTTLSSSLAQSQCPFSDLLHEDEWCQSFATPVSSAASALPINSHPTSPTSIDCLVPSHDEYLTLLDGTKYSLVEVMDNLKDEERTPPMSPIPFQSNKTPTKRESKVDHTSSPDQNSDHGKLQYVLNSSTSGSSPTPHQTREQQRRRQRSYEQKYRTKRRDVLRRSRRQWLQLELQVAQLLRSYPGLYTKHRTTSRAQERYLEGFNEIRARRYENFRLSKLVAWCDCMKERNYSADTIRNREDWDRIEQLILGVSVQHPFVPDPFKFTW